MINRSLIRIKTVQILYSYLLTRSDFKLAAAPNPNETSRDRQFAYTVYLDLLGLLLKLSGAPVGKYLSLGALSDPVLAKNRVGHALAQEAELANALTERYERINAFDGCLADITATIVASNAYADFKRRRKRRMTDDVSFWVAVFTEVLRKNKSIERVLRQDEKFSHVGLDMGMNMLTATLGGLDDKSSGYDKALEDLDESLRQAYNLYHAILMLPVALTDLQLERMERAKQKYLPTETDLNPSTRLVENKYVAAVRADKAITEYADENPDSNPVNWRDFETAASRLLDMLLQSELYAEYLKSEPGDYATDTAFWREALRNIILPSDELAEVLENKSVYWNDDLSTLSDFALKTMRRSYAKEADDDDTPVGRLVLMPMFMNAQDERFGMELFKLVTSHREQYRAYIDEFIDSRTWDSDRIAFMDVVILMTAIAEIINYPSIPVPASINEYIEIANDYSTPKSGAFINGILASIVEKLKREGVINK